MNIRKVRAVVRTFFFCVLAVSGLIALAIRSAGLLAATGLGYWFLLLTSPQIHVTSCNDPDLWEIPPAPPPPPQPRGLFLVTSPNGPASSRRAVKRPKRARKTA